MLASIARKGHEAILIAKGSDRSVDGFQMIGLTSNRSRLKTVNEAYEKAKSIGADIFHLHDPELLPVGFLLQKAGAKIVYDIHEDYRWKATFLGRIIRLVELWAFNWLDHVIVAEDDYLKFVPPRVPTTAILNYHNRNVSSEHRTADFFGRRFSIVYTGVVSNLRGLSTILKVARLAKEENKYWRFMIAWICHSADERREAEKFISDNDLGNLVELRGWDQYLPQDEIFQIQNRADVGLVLLKEHGNYIHTIPTKFYEYMSTGLPFVCSNFGGWNQFVSDNRCGISCDATSAEEVVTILERLHTDAEFYQKLSQDSLNASRRYHWSKMEDRLISIYESVISESVVTE
jgi:glycosyltransferase involved in cell wall biosynthesis